MDKNNSSHNCPKIDFTTTISNECGITKNEVEKAILDYLLAIEEVLDEEDQ